MLAPTFAHLIFVHQAALFLKILNDSETASVPILNKASFSFAAILCVVGAIFTLGTAVPPIPKRNSTASLYFPAVKY
jgi:hypothetical protein